MNTVSETLGNSGAPVEATLPDGRVLLVRRLDQGGKTRIEQHLKATARVQLFEDKADLTDAEFALAYGAFSDRVASSDYKFGGGIYVKFLQSGAGGLFLTRMLSTVDGKEQTEDELMILMANKGVQDVIRGAVQQAVAESFPKG